MPGALVVIIPLLVRVILSELTQHIAKLVVGHNAAAVAQGQAKCTGLAQGAYCANSCGAQARPLAGTMALWAAT